MEEDFSVWKEQFWTDLCSFFHLPPCSLPPPQLAPSFLLRYYSPGSPELQNEMEKERKKVSTYPYPITSRAFAMTDVKSLVKDLPVVTNIELTQPDAEGSIREIDIDLSQVSSGFRYITADTLGIISSSSSFGSWWSWCPVPVPVSSFTPLMHCLILCTHSLCPGFFLLSSLSCVGVCPRNEESLVMRWASRLGVNAGDYFTLSKVSPQSKPHLVWLFDCLFVFCCCSCCFLVFCFVFFCFFHSDFCWLLLSFLPACCLLFHFFLLLLFSSPFCCFLLGSVRFPVPRSCCSIHDALAWHCDFTGISSRGRWGWGKEDRNSRRTGEENSREGGGRKEGQDGRICWSLSCKLLSCCSLSLLYSFWFSSILLLSLLSLPSSMPLFAFFLLSAFFAGLPRRSVLEAFAQWVIDEEQRKQFLVQACNSVWWSGNRNKEDGAEHTRRTRKEKWLDTQSRCDAGRSKPSCLL